jgi:hypothetical protein
MNQTEFFQDVDMEIRNHWRNKPKNNYMETFHGRGRKIEHRQGVSSSPDLCAQCNPNHNPNNLLCGYWPKFLNVGKQKI